MQCPHGQPNFPGRAPLPPELPNEYATDYDEAGRVLSVSAKASAALSRRALQRLLHNHFNIKKANLAAEIDAVVPTLPSHLAEAIDGVRTTGNFAAHPINLR